MRVVFADSGYWIALLNPNDSLNRRATEISRTLGDVQIVTSEMVLVDVLNSLASKGPSLQFAAFRTVQAIDGNGGIALEPQTRELFQNARSLYQTRSDKEWSLTDCASFVIMQRRNIAEALAHDHHFIQAGYRALLREH